MSHKSTRVSEVKVGVFVLGALSILIVGALWMTGSQFLKGSQTSYWVLMKSSAGIEVGDRVRMAGVTIGRVNEVRLRPNEAWPVAFHVGLRSDIPIKTDSTARVMSSGLLGDGFLQIDPGNSKSPILTKEGEILGQITPDLQDILAKVEEISSRAVGSLDQMTAFMNEVSQEARPLLKNLNALLSEENTTHVRQILSNLDNVLDQSGPHFSSFASRLDTISNRLDSTLEEASLMMKNFSGLEKDVHTSIGPNGIRLTEVLSQAEKTLASAQRSLSVIDDSREELAATMKELRITASNLKMFSQQIKERPFSLIRIHPKPDRRPGQGLSR